MSSATVRRVRVSIRSRHSMSGRTAETSRSKRIGFPDTLCTSRGPSTTSPGSGCPAARPAAHQVGDVALGIARELLVEQPPVSAAVADRHHLEQRVLAQPLAGAGGRLEAPHVLHPGRDLRPHLRALPRVGDRAAVAHQMHDERVDARRRGQRERVGGLLRRVDHRIPRRTRRARRGTASRAGLRSARTRDRSRCGEAAGSASGESAASDRGARPDRASRPRPRPQTSRRRGRAPRSRTDRPRTDCPHEQRWSSTTPRCQMKRSSPTGTMLRRRASRSSSSVEPLRPAPAM